MPITGSVQAERQCIALPDIYPSRRISYSLPMLTHFKSLLIAGALCTFANVAAADGPDSSGDATGIYLAVRGYGSIEDQNNFHFDNSRELAGAVGCRFHENWRAEAEYSTRWSDISGLNGALTTTGKANVQTLGAHIFYDFRSGQRIRPFVGMGAGASRLDFKFEGPADHFPSFIVRGDDTNYGHYFNVLAGVTYNVSPALRLGLGVEYVTLPDDAIESNIGGIEGINRSYNYFLSARWFFAHR